MKPSTEELRTQLEQLVKTYNESVQTQQKCKDAIIATQAVIQDRESQDGDTDTVTSSLTKD
tara:strand:+ start:1174 stop:1356 length:183 start_codon:yes stop_codon:yes gene_type:complete